MLFEIQIQNVLFFSPVDNRQLKALTPPPPKNNGPSLKVSHHSPYWFCILLARGRPPKLLGVRRLGTRVGFFLKVNLRQLNKSRHSKCPLKSYEKKPWMQVVSRLLVTKTFSSGFRQFQQKLAIYVDAFTLIFFKGLCFQYATAMRGRVSRRFWKTREGDDITRSKGFFRDKLMFSCFREQGISPLLNGTLRKHLGNNGP